MNIKMFKLNCELVAGKSSCIELTAAILTKEGYGHFKGHILNRKYVEEFIPFGVVDHFRQGHVQCISQLKSNGGRLE
jgi:hypothetical protein